MIEDSPRQAWRNLTWLPGAFAICRFEPTSPVPETAPSGFFSLTRTETELSIVCREEVAPPGGRVEAGWKAFRVDGPIPFSVTGVLAAIAVPLSDAGISVFAVATFDTDSALIRGADAARAKRALESAGFSFSGEP